MCSPDQTGRELTQGVPLPATADVKVFLGFMKATGIQLSAGEDTMTAAVEASRLSREAYQRLIECDLIFI